jgi:hypothetical protein
LHRFPIQDKIQKNISVSNLTIFGLLGGNVKKSTQISHQLTSHEGGKRVG